MTPSKINPASMAATKKKMIRVAASVPCDKGNSYPAAALSVVLLLLPISHGRSAHWSKPTELLDFDVVGSRCL
jgi:hypothetical protein